ncbi:hypothetical protein DFH94DRAFT_80792 [Russula ochroleuca]|uniref:Uncharacterized protein n=1 Tax=Russula ochroleuca TaxID=152965 RepID=A0A9P5T6J8_9AGAM|nr:hypothetical protein DFH94DRAFT_80792 [Russula ochroleuca]
MSLWNATRSLTPALRRLAYRQARTVSPRHFSTSAHGPSKSSDTPWMIGSALIFIPTIGYLFSPSARSKPHHAHSATDHGQPRAPAENTPKAPSLPPAESTKNEETIADDEGTEVPVEQVKASVTQAVEQDSPKEAAQAEAEIAESIKNDDGAADQASEAETDHEQKPHTEPEENALRDEKGTKPRPTQARECPKAGYE